MEPFGCLPTELLLSFEFSQTNCLFYVPTLCQVGTNPSHIRQKKSILLCASLRFSYISNSSSHKQSVGSDSVASCCGHAGITLKLTPMTVEKTWVTGVWVTTSLWYPLTVLGDQPPSVNTLSSTCTLSVKCRRVSIPLYENQ